MASYDIIVHVSTISKLLFDCSWLRWLRVDWMTEENYFNTIDVQFIIQCSRVCRRYSVSGLKYAFLWVNRLTNRQGWLFSPSHHFVNFAKYCGAGLSSDFAVWSKTVFLRLSTDLKDGSTDLIYLFILFHSCWL